MEEISVKVCVILDNLTPENFKASVEQIKELPIDTEQELEEIANLIYERAIAEPVLSIPYAKLSKQLASVKVPSDNGKESCSLRKLILTKCQKEFEHAIKENKKKDASKGEKPEELQLEEREQKRKIRRLGNIRFIGEIYKLQMLIAPIMHECIKALLDENTEESLECVCCLLKSVGYELDENGLKESSNPMDAHFEEIQSTVCKHLVSSKISFMLQEIMDMRKNNWFPSRYENHPKIIDKIHAETENDACEIQRDCQSINCSKYHPDDRQKIFGFEKLKQDFQEILVDGTLSDLILNVAGQEYKAHRCVLAARSPVFLAMMTHDTEEKRNGVVPIPDVDPCAFSDFLSYLYTGSIENLTSERAVKLYTTADKYQVNELKEICLDHMLTNIAIDNFCDVFTLSLQHNKEDLKQSCIRFFKENSLDIVLTVKWQTFLCENPIVGNELYIKRLQWR